MVRKLRRLRRYRVCYAIVDKVTLVKPYLYGVECSVEYREDFMEYPAEFYDEEGVDFMMKTLVIAFLGGTEIVCKNKEG